MKELLIILVSSAIVHNVVLSQFLGLCPFFGVSKKTETAVGMGGALIFVITLSSFVTGLIYKFILVPSGMEYLQTIVFILIIAALVQYEYNILQGTINGFATAVGFTISITLMADIREKIQYNDIPEAFKGFPTVLLTAGLMAIAFFGFSGLI